MIEARTEDGLKIKEVNGQKYFSAILELEDGVELPIWVPFLYQQEELNTQSQETLNKDVDKMAQSFSCDQRQDIIWNSLDRGYWDCMVTKLDRERSRFIWQYHCD